MKLFLFESKKLWRSAGFRNLCLALLALNLVFILFGGVSEPDSAAKRTHVDSYTDNISYVIRVAQRNLTEYEATAGRNSYLVRYQEDVVERYTALLEKDVTPASIVGWDAFFSHTRDDLLLMLIAVLVGTVLAMTEHDHGTHTLVKITPRGKKSVQSKILVLGVFSFIAALGMELITLLGIALRFGLSSPAVPLCSVIRFTYCPSHISILSYLLASLLTKAVYVWALMLFAAAVSSLFQSYLVSFFASAGILVIGYMISHIPTNNGWLFINPYTLGISHPLWERYRSVNVFGASVPLTLTATVLLLLMCLAPGALFVLCAGRLTDILALDKWEKSVKKLASRAKEKFLALLPRHKPRSHSLFFTEVKKILVKSHLLLLCASMLLIKLLYTDATLPETYSAEKYYRAMCDELAGELTEEKRLLIGDKLQQSAAVLAQENSM